MDTKVCQIPETLIDLIEGLDAWRERPAIRFGGETPVDEWSFADVHSAARRFGAGLKRDGIRAGEHVVLMAPNRPEWVVAALGVIHAGAVLVPVDHQLDDESLVHILKDCRPALILTASVGARRLERSMSGSAPVYLLDAPAGSPECWRSLVAKEYTPPVKGHPDRPAVMFYTSGTTGPPKGVPLTHGNLSFQVRTLLEIRIAAPTDRCLLPLPLHHVYPFVVGMLTSLAYGMCLLFPERPHGPQILETLRHGGATVILGVPRLYDVMLAGIGNRVRARGRVAATVFHVLLGGCTFLRRRLKIPMGRWVFRSLHRRLGPGVRMVVSGGAALNPKLALTMEALGWLVASGYGLTETSPLISLLQPGDDRPESAGRPVAGVEVRIASTEKSHDTSAGEILVRGPGVFSGYHNLPERTRQAFTPDGWLRTDDLGYLDKDGFLHVLGRASTLIVTAAGENIQPEDVEEAYGRHAIIQEIGVLAGEAGLAAVVVPAAGVIRKGEEATVDQKMRLAVGEIAKAVPTYWHITDLVVSQESLQRTRLGKIRRAQLKDRYEALKAGRAAGSAFAPGPMSLDEMTEDDRDLVTTPAANAVWDWLARRYADRRLTLDTSPALDLGIDSLEWMSVTLEIQRLTGGEIAEEATATIQTVRDLLIEAVRSAERGPAAEGAAPAGSTLHLNAWQRRWLTPLGAWGRACAFVLHAVVRFFALTLFRLEVTGREHLPRHGNFILSPNHTSVLDPFALAAALDFALLRQTFWAAWTGMAFANPLFRAVSRLAQALPIEADRAAFSSLALAEVVLNEGRNLVWFPEGGRSHSGQLEPFKPGIGVLLTKCNVPVVPVSIEGTFEAMPTGRIIPNPRKVRVTFGEPATRRDLELAGKADSTEERITSALHDLVARLNRDRVPPP